MSVRDAENMSRCGAYCKENWPDEAAHIIRVADEVRRNYFLFDLPWDMERTYEPVIFDGEIDWEYLPGDDPEFIYQMNRHRYFICLGQAYVMTGEEEYAECFVRLLMDWASRVPLTEESKRTTWRSIEAGLRGEYWTKAFSYFAHSPSVTCEVRDTYRRILRIHGEYLLESYGNFQISSNWGVLENHGLYLIGRELGEEGWCTAALERLALEAQVQILGDGVHWEQSAMYHNEVMLCYMEVLREALSERTAAEAGSCAWLADAAERERFAWLADAVEAMSLADLYWKKPNHRQPLYGDSDDTDLREVLTRAALLMARWGREETAVRLKAAGYDRLDFEGCWDYGYPAVEEYAGIPAGEPGALCRGLDDSGNYIWRSSWREDGDYIHFRNGFLGGGHGHSDKLHFSLCWDGEDVLVDSGRCHYVNDEDRIWFKSAFAHNTVLVDGRDHLGYQDAWGVEHGMTEVRQPMQQKNGVVLLEGGHTGYLQRGCDVLLNRKLLVLEDGLLLVLDTAVTPSEHTYQRLFHFSERGSVEQEKDVTLFQGSRTCGRLWLGNADTIERSGSRISRHYNESADNICISASTEGRGLTVMAAILSKGRTAFAVEERPVWSKVKGAELGGDSARSWRITRDGHVWDVILRLCDLGGDAILLESGGCMGIGRVLASRDGGKTICFY